MQMKILESGWNKILWQTHKVQSNMKWHENTTVTLHLYVSRMDEKILTLLSLLIPIADKKEKRIEWAAICNLEWLNLN